MVVAVSEVQLCDRRDDFPGGKAVASEREHREIDPRSLPHIHTCPVRLEIRVVIRGWVEMLFPFEETDRVTVDRLAELGHFPI